MSRVRPDYYAHYLDSRANQTVKISKSEYNQLMVVFSHWNEIEELAKDSPVVKHHLDELMAAIKLIKG